MSIRSTRCHTRARRISTRSWSAGRRSRAWAASTRRCWCRRTGILPAPGGEWRALSRRSRQRRHRAAAARQSSRRLCHELQRRPSRCSNATCVGTPVAAPAHRLRGACGPFGAQLERSGGAASRGAAARGQDRPHRPPRPLDRHVSRFGAPAAPQRRCTRCTHSTVAATLTVSADRSGTLTLADADWHAVGQAVYRADS